MSGPVAGGVREEESPSEDEHADAPATDPGAPDESEAQDFPSTRLERGTIAAKAGLKAGTNYAKYLARRAARTEDPEVLRRKMHDRVATDIFSELVKLRGTALKLAQGMSMDPGMLPDEFVNVMSRAQYSVPPMSRALVRRLVTQRLGGAPEKVFASFEPEAAAAASIGQVHRAILHDGRRVAVKVQYPNVRATIESDLLMARSLARRVAPALLKSGRVEPFIDEVREMMGRETDYHQEGQSIEFFAAQYGSDWITTPRWVPEHSTESLLTMTWVEGVRIDEFLERNPSQEERDHYGQLFWDFVSTQVSSDSCTVHADVHPGNFLFREDRRLGVIDFGCVKVFPRDFREAFLLIWDAYLNDRAEIRDDLYWELEVFQDDQTPEVRAKISDFFNRFAWVILAPFRSESFDFGTNDFRDSLLPLFREASQFNVAVGSRHFVFINRLLFGLFSVLTRLQPRIATAPGRAQIESAVERIRKRREARAT